MKKTTETTSAISTIPSLEYCLTGLLSHSGHALRGILGMGLYLTKAQALFALPAGQRGQGRKSSATVAHDSEAAPGFDQWLAENVTPLGHSRRTVYNYMTAAARVGLGPASTEADLAALKLDGMKASQLYLPETSTEKAPEKAPAITPLVAACHLWQPLWDQLADAGSPTAPTSTALWHLPLVSADPCQPSLAALEIKLKATMEMVREISRERAAAAR